jgi:hypothetical protein
VDVVGRRLIEDRLAVALLLKSVNSNERIAFCSCEAKRAKVDRTWHAHVLFEVAVHLGISSSEDLGKIVGEGDKPQLQACRAMGKLIHKIAQDEGPKFPMYFVETVLRNRMTSTATGPSLITPMRLIQLEVPLIKYLPDCRYGLRCPALNCFLVSGSKIRVVFFSVSEVASARICWI